jgi:hypothetical protein
MSDELKYEFIAINNDKFYFILKSIIEEKR